MSRARGASRACCALMEVGARHGSYALRYWLDDPRPDDATHSEVRGHILAALERHRMKLGAPYVEELAIRDDLAHRAELQALEHRRRVSAPQGVALFAALSAAERESLATHLTRAPSSRAT